MRLGREYHMVGRVDERERQRGRAAPRGSMAVGLLCTVVLAGVGYVAWELRGIAANRADGDPAQGVYQQDPERADKTAASVLDGLVREDPEPPTDGKAFGDGGGPVDWRYAGWQPSDPLEAGPAPAEPAVGALFSPAATATPTTTARPSWSTPRGAT